MTNYICLRCGYNTSIKVNMTTHLNRKKICKPLIRDIKIDDYRSYILKEKFINNLPQIAPNYPICEYCQKIYTRKHKLQKHMQVCALKPTENNIIEHKQIIPYTNVNNMIINQNTLLLEHISLLHEKLNEQNYIFNEKIDKQSCNINNKFNEQNEKLNNLEIKTMNNNQLNNVINIGTFLNEKCANAYNIEDLKDMIPCNLQVLEDFAKRGYNEGTNYMIYNSIKDMSIYERPFHCLDVKRDIIHVKTEGVWKIDTELKCMRQLLFDVEKKLQLEYNATCDKYENAGGDSALGNYLSKMQNAVWCIGYDYDESYRRIYNKLFKQVHISKKQIKEYYNAV
jgi:hypothetical protein